MLDARPQEDAGRSLQGRTRAAQVPPPDAASPVRAAIGPAALPPAAQHRAGTPATTPIEAAVAPAIGQAPFATARRDSAPVMPERIGEPCRPARPAATLRDAPLAAHHAAAMPEPRRYARRLMQASGDTSVQITLRDAALDAGQTLAVASNVFVRLREAGVCVQRLYINGQLFDAPPRDAQAPTPPDALKE